MKKLVAFLAVLGLCACAGVNKNTVSYQMGKYDQHTYYVVAGEGADKEAASANACLKDTIKSPKSIEYFRIF